MNPAKKLLMEAILIPLIFWIILWSLFYLHSSPDLPRKNYNVGWIITVAVSLFLTLVFVFWHVQRTLRKAGYPQVGLGELFRALGEADPRIVNNSVREAFITVLLWGSFCTAVLLRGFKGGVILTVDFAMAFVVIALPLMVSMMTPFAKESEAVPLSAVACGSDHRSYFGGHIHSAVTLSKSCQ